MRGANIAVRVAAPPIIFGTKFRKEFSMEKLENLKQQVLALDEDELFDIYEFVDDLILARTLKEADQKGSRNESLFENKEYIQD